MSSTLATTRRIVQKIGLDVQRYPNLISDPLWPVAKLLRSLDISAVLDVGANDGGYGRAIRKLGYRRGMWSFEPLAEPFAKLRTITDSDPLWQSMQCAVGASDGNVTINVAGNNAASSSVLPMLERHRAAAITSAYIGTEEAVIKKLDGLIPDLSIGLSDRIFLKIDVQGYEAAVLDGADHLLESGRVTGIQMELSFVDLYEGGMTWRQGFARATGYGMELMGLIPGFSDSSGRMLQADAIFCRPGGD